MTAGHVQLVYVLGAGHCGSTLLNLLLNGHSRIVGLSEVSKLERLTGPDAAVLRDPTWTAIDARLAREHGLRLTDLRTHHPSVRIFARWSVAEVRAWATPLAALFDAVAAETGADLVVDASKSWQQLALYHRAGLFPIRVIHLVRDGRAVLHSYQRKYGRFAHAFGQWAKPSLAAPLLRASFAPDAWRQVRYEDLASAPEATLRAICAFLGVAYEPAMLRFRDHPSLAIGGNRMRHDRDATIRLDERWRRELPLLDRARFELVGAPLNLWYGYRPAGRPR